MKISRNSEISSSVVKWLRLIRMEFIARWRFRLTANTARDGVPSTEQADFTDTQTPRASSAAAIAAPRTPSTRKFRICGIAWSGLLIAT